MAATVLVQRGLDNLFLLSGGLKVLGQKFPVGFYSDILPASCQPPPPPRPRLGSTPKSVIGPSKSLAVSAVAAQVSSAEHERNMEDVALRLLPLTRSNLEKIRSQLETNLLCDDASSVTTTARSVRPRPPATTRLPPTPIPSVKKGLAQVKLSSLATGSSAAKVVVAKDK